MPEPGKPQPITGSAYVPAVYVLPSFTMSWPVFLTGVLVTAVIAPVADVVTVNWDAS